MGMIISFVLMVFAFISGVYMGDNSTLMDCMRVGATRLNGTTVQCEAPRPAKPAPGTEPAPNVKDATNQMMDFMMRKIQEMDRADKERSAQQAQQRPVIHQAPVQVQPQAQPVPQSQHITVGGNDTSAVVSNGNPIVQNKPTPIDTESTEEPIR